MTPLVVFAAAVGVLAFGYLVFRVIVRNDYLRRGRLSWQASLLQVFAILLYMHFAYLEWGDVWPALPSMPDNRLQSVVGLALVGVGALFALAGMASLGWRRIMGLDSSGLYQKGLYRLSRNPQLLAFFAVALGFAVLWPSWVVLVWVLLYFPFFHLMVMSEEEYLRMLYGEKYEAFCAEVRRY